MGKAYTDNGIGNEEVTKIWYWILILKQTFTIINLLTHTQIPLISFRRENIVTCTRNEEKLRKKGIEIYLWLRLLCVNPYNLGPESQPSLIWNFLILGNLKLKKLCFFSCDRLKHIEQKVWNIFRESVCNCSCKK